ncbi:MAG: hypothetical protein U0Q21_14005 [Dermatophilaceae bacterium]
MTRHTRQGGFSFPPLAALPVITLAQARRSSGEQAVRWRLESGRWQRVHQGVYVTHSGPIDWPTRVAAAILAASRPSTRTRDAARSQIVGLAGRTAAYVDGLTDDQEEQITLAVPRGRRLAPPAGVRLVTSRRLVIRTGIWPPRTTIESTILWLAEMESPDTTLALVGRALQQRRTTMSRLQGELNVWPRHARRHLLDAVLLGDADGAESALELRWFRDVERPHGIPPATRQVPTVIRGRGRRYDLDWEEARLCVELDGLLFHTAATALADRQKINAAARRRRTHLRFGWLEITGDPCAAAAELVAAALGNGARWPVRGCRRPGCPLAATRPLAIGE